MKTWHALLFVAAIWAGIYLPGLGSTELKGEEARRIMPGAEMLRTGDWVVPRVAGLPYSRKPPLVNWLAAISFKVSGVHNEWSGRMPTALAVLVLASTTALLLSLAWKPEAGLLAAIFTMTNIGLVEKGRLAEIEGVFIAMFGIALLLWIFSWLIDGSEWSRWIPAFLFLGLGFLAKGPVHLLFFYVIVVAILVKGKRKRELAHPAHFLGWGVFAGVVLPWGLRNAERNPTGDSGDVWMEQLTSRLSPESIDFGNWLLQIPQSVINFLPWALLLPLLWHGHTVAAIEARSARAKSLFRGLRWGLVCAFLVIVLIPTSRPRFSMPLLVPASVLLALAVTELRGARLEKVAASWWWCCAVAMAAITLALAVSPFFVEGARWLPAAVVAAGGAYGLWQLRRRKGRMGPEQLGVFSAGFFVLVAGFFVFVVAPVMRGHENVRSFGGEIREAVGEEASVGVFGAGYQPFVFYLGENAREIGRAEDLPAGIDFLLMRDAFWEAWKPHLLNLYGAPAGTRPFVNPREPEAYQRYVLVEFEDR